MKNEPVINRALLAAVFQMLALFGYALAPEDQEAVTVLVLAAVPVITLVAAWFARRRVTPVDR